jgi:pilus assembly protein CpaF
MSGATTPRTVRETVAGLDGHERSRQTLRRVNRSADSALVRADGYPPQAERFARHGYDRAALLSGERAAY